METRMPVHRSSLWVGEGRIQTDSNPEIGYGVMACLALLVFTTVAEPDEHQVASFGTSAPFSPVVLKVSRLAGRLLAALIIGYLLLKQSSSPTFQRGFRLYLPFFIFVGYGFLSILWSPLKSVSFNQCVSFGIIIALSFLISVTWRSTLDTSRLLASSLIIMLIASLILLAYRLMDPAAGALTRESSGVFHATNAGAMASLAILLLFSALCIWSWTWTRYLFVPGLTISVLVLLLGGNRLSLLACGIGVTFVFIRVLPWSILTRWTIGLAIAGTIYLCIDPGLTWLERLISTGVEVGSQGQSRQQLNELSGRSEMWSLMWESYLQAPILGHGFFVTSATGEIYAWDEWGNWTAHNAVLQLLTTLGLCGFLLWVSGFLFLALNLSYHAYGGHPWYGQHFTLIVAAGLWFSIWSLLNESIFGPLQPETVIFSVILGLAGAITINGDQDAETQAVTSNHHLRAIEESQ